MKKYQVSKDDKSKIANQVASVIQEIKEAGFAYIFGSFATEKTFSDVDIGIYLDKYEPEKVLELELSLEGKLQAMIHLPVDVRVINHAPLSFVYAVIRDGILILDRDSSKRADFEGLIYKKYFDFAPFRREYLREITHAPL